MFLAIHAAIGANIGLRVQNPIIAFFLAFISHFVFDAIPHGDENLGPDFQNNQGKKIKFFLVIGFDVILTIVGILISILFGQPASRWSVSCGIVGGLLPDLLQAVYLYSKHPFFKGFFDLHHALHYNGGRFTMPLRYGFLFQMIILVLILLTFK